MALEKQKVEKYKAEVQDYGERLGKEVQKMIDCSKTENYFAEKVRMTKRAENGLCKLVCSNCPLCSGNNNKGLSCTGFEMLYPEKAIAIVQKWSDEHPQKTYLSEFLKNYPNTPLDDDGTPDSICPYDLGLMSIDDCNKDYNCVKCWNQPIKPIKDGEE